MVKVREAVWMDVILLMPQLRPADVAECEALFGKGSAPGIAAETFRGSRIRYAIEDDGVLIGLFGVGETSVVSPVGHPWMFGSAAMDKALRRAVITQYRPYLAHMLEHYPKLMNVVDARNHKSIRWLRYMGFNIKPAIPMGVSGLPFHPFEMEN